MCQRRRRQIGFVAGLIATAVGTGLYAYNQRYKHFEVHEPGMVYRSAWLEPDVFRELIEKYQIRTVVNLCKPDEMGRKRIVEERAAVIESGAELIELSMPLTIEADNPVIAHAIDILGNPNHYPLLVHCQHGVTRTAKFLAIYDIAYRGMSAEQSLTAQPLFGRDDHNVHVRAFARNFEVQRERLYPVASHSNIKQLRD